MTSRWLTLLETHIEKGILGLAVLCLGAMLWMYLINSPNKVPYGGKEQGPGDLMTAIKSDADGLEARLRNADVPDPEKIKKYSDQLKDQHNAGIFARAPEDAAPPLPKSLPLASSLGHKIEVPGLKESDTPANSIVLVTPLKPSQPKLLTGRSLALPKQTVVTGLSDEAEEIAEDDEEVEATEVAWVSIAAYFNKKAQYTEMIKAGYAPYRSKAYVVGLDVQRQEMLSSGEFSDWKDVQPGKAMPKVELADPQFDDETGELLNKDDIRQTFGAIKLAQTQLMQPDFYDVDDGDFWEIPAIAGYEQDEEAEEEEPEEEAPAVAGRGVGRSMGPRVTPGPRPSPRGGTRSGPSIGGRGGRGGGPTMPGGRGGASAGGRGVSYPGAGAGGQSDAQKKREARKQIRADLKEAKILYSKKEFTTARDLASRIIVNEFASAGDKRNAEQLVSRAEKAIEREMERLGGGAYAGGRGRGSGGRDLAETVKNPETREPAVWFHDDSVEAGKTYRYRMRVRLWNRYVGRLRDVKDPEYAKKPVVVGEWSYPSEPVTVTPSTYFFFSGARPPETASVDVWKWRQGLWLRERFDVKVGDVIGGVENVKTGGYDEEGDEEKADVDFTTGAVVLDMRFDEPVAERIQGKDEVFSYRDKTSTVMVYLDPADGQVKEKVLMFDRRDPKKKELEDEEI